MKPLNIKFVYLKDPENPNHAVTAVGVLKNGEDYEVQIARCHAPDHFCKHIAREIIKGRFRKHGAKKKYPIEAFSNPRDLYEELDFDWNPITGNEFPVTSFALED